LIGRKLLIWHQRSERLYAEDYAPPRLKSDRLLAAGKPVAMNRAGPGAGAAARSTDGRRATLSCASANEDLTDVPAHH
jgi:hypothetical protein